MAAAETRRNGWTESWAASTARCGISFSAKHLEAGHCFVFRFFFTIWAAIHSPF
ncbi:hypothetical protein CE91St63_06050 [[Clostridium] hylemonae]|nr:hypothetical protein CE91St63_06050 [[Clostridium] hylemonae]